MMVCYEPVSSCGVNMRLVLLFMVSACLDQYDPRRHWQKFADERQLAHQQLASLNEDGTLPSPEQKEVDLTTVVNTKYALYCSSCHGDNGAGDGASAKAYSPPPRDFTDRHWQQQNDDQRIATVIRDGGNAVGLSSAMAAFGAILNQQEVDEMVAKIRRFATSEK